MAGNMNKSKKVAKKQATEGSSDTNRQLSCKKPSNKKRSKKAGNPKSQREQPEDSKSSNKPRICENSACRKVLAKNVEFCPRCSCCFCGKFDDNKDTSQWLECKYQCDSESDKCGLSCHVECALEKHDVGVIYHGSSIQMDCGYRCRICGNTSGILDYWKKQLVIARQSRRLGSLSYKINLSCRLLDGTLKFKVLHEIVKDAKAKLESEIGPTDMESASTLHGLVGRLSVADDIRYLCSLAIDKAEEILANPSDANPLTTAHGCNFECDEVTFSSVQITVLGLLSAAVMPGDLKGYKLWHYKTREEIRPKEPTRLIPTTVRKVTITNLEPSTEYTFCVAAYSEAGDWGQSEVNCVTKGVELVEMGQSHMDLETDGVSDKEPNNATWIRSSDHQGQDLGTSFCLDAANQQGGSFRELRRDVEMEENSENRPDNLMIVPDLNEEVLPPYDSSKESENIEEHARFNGQGFLNPDTNGPNTGFTSKEDQMHDGDITLSPQEDKNLEHCIKTIRKLERGGHITPDFRMKLLTWLCIRATPYQRRLVHVFIEAFTEDPDELTTQLVHSFPDIVSSKKNTSSSGNI